MRLVLVYAFFTYLCKNGSEADGGRGRPSGGAGLTKGLPAFFGTTLLEKAHSTIQEEKPLQMTEADSERSMTSLSFLGCEFRMKRRECGVFSKLDARVPRSDLSECEVERS